MEERFNALIEEAESTPFTGWDFGWLGDRWRTTPSSWNYVALARDRLQRSKSAVDLGTGGGEILAQMAPFMGTVMATEAYPPNVEVARRTLAPLGAEVVQVDPAPDNMHMQAGEGIGTLPFKDGEFDLVLNRHDSYYADEVIRILTPGGTYLTQQVGGTHLKEINRLLGAPHGQFAGWNAAFAAEQLRQAGFEIVDVREQFPETWFGDIGAIVYYLNAVPWEIEDFTVGRYRAPLLALHERMEREGGLTLQEHLFLVEARRENA